MSVRINPCFGCPLRKGCDQRKDFASRVRGLGLRSCTFRCAKLSEALKPGTRITVRQTVVEEDSGPYGETGICHVIMPATITSSDGNTFSCVVDRDAMLSAGHAEPEADRFRFRKRMRHSKIVAFLNEPTRRICAAGNVVEMSDDGPCCHPRVKDNYSHGCHCKFTREEMRRYGVVAA